jgi:hypothetical protein
MKPATTLLAASTVALAIATVYLGRDLAAARAEAEDAARLASHLGARVTELQQSRAAAPVLPALQTPGAAGPGALPQPRPAAAPEGEAELTVAQQAELAARERDRFAQRLQSPAAQRALKAQVRTGVKRMYGDFVAAHGLSAEEADALYDLVAAQQLDANLGVGVDAGSAHDLIEREKTFQREVAGLLGEQRAARLREYQGTFDTRGQILQLEEQLAGSDTPLTDEQRRRLVKAVLQDAEQFPAPQFGGRSSPAEMEQAYADWQRDRTERFAAAARTILTPQQARQYEDLREMQRVFQGN